MTEEMREELARSPRAESPAKISRSLSPMKSPRKDEEPAPPPKRARVAASNEERARSKRMFGNLLGTLRKFQDDDKNKRGSEAAKRREQTAQRIAAKLASETNLQNDIATSEKELRSLKVATESAGYILEHREVALSARHASLRTAGKYLHTSVTDSDPVFASTTLLYADAPVPLVRGPGKATTASAPPLFFLPKILLPHQEDALSARQAEIEKLIDDESDKLAADKDAHVDTASTNADKIADLTAKLQRLKEQQAAARAGRAGQNSDGRRDSTTRDRNDSVDQEREIDLRAGDEDMEVEY